VWIYRRDTAPNASTPAISGWNFVNTPKVISGINESSLRAVKKLYDQLVDKTVPVSRPKEAELTKLLENTFRHVNIALVNEIAVFAHQLGVDVWEAIEAAPRQNRSD
jgi:UDP-N-acetyl-D-mannosaminuronate dehydrogenase